MNGVSATHQFCDSIGIRLRFRRSAALVVGSYVSTVIAFSFGVFDVILCGRWYNVPAANISPACSSCYCWQQAPAGLCYCVMVRSVTWRRNGVTWWRTVPSRNILCYERKGDKLSRVFPPSLQMVWDELIIGDLIYEANTDYDWRCPLTCPIPNTWWGC